MMHNSSNEHLHCPWCQYDLFGLPLRGHIVRCPECGETCDLRLLRIPEIERAARVRGLYALPLTAVSLLVLAVYCGIPCVTSPTHEIGLLERLWFACGFLWAGCVGLYLTRYRFVIGAVWALAMFHAGGILCAAAVGLTFTPGFVSGLIQPPPSVLSPQLLAAASSVAIGVFVLGRTRGIVTSMRGQLIGRGDV